MQQLLDYTESYIIQLCYRSTSSGDRIRRESSSSQETSSRKDRHRAATSVKGISYYFASQ